MYIYLCKAAYTYVQLWRASPGEKSFGADSPQILSYKFLYLLIEKYLNVIINYKCYLVVCDQRTDTTTSFRMSS